MGPPNPIDSCMCPAQWQTCQTCKPFPKTALAHPAILLHGAPRGGHRTLQLAQQVAAKRQCQIKLVGHTHTNSARWLLPAAGRAAVCAPHARARAGATGVVGLGEKSSQLPLLEGWRRRSVRTRRRLLMQPAQAGQSACRPASQAGAPRVRRRTVHQRRQHARGGGRATGESGQLNTPGGAQSPLTGHWGRQAHKLIKGPNCLVLGAQGGACAAHGAGAKAGAGGGAHMAVRPGRRCTVAIGVAAVFTAWVVQARWARGGENTSRRHSSKHEIRGVR